MKLIVGLGNPGEKYLNTRHNLGFLALDHFADGVGARIDQKKKKTLYGKMEVSGEELILLKPQTFMNLSGEAVLYMASFLKIPPQDIIVVCDDVTLPFGTIRIREKGSDGGHNGLKSLISSLDSNEFPRIRVGVDAPDTEEQELSEFVLDPFSGEQLASMPKVLDRVSGALSLLVKDDKQKAMNSFNGPLPQTV